MNNKSFFRLIAAGFILSLSVLTGCGGTSKTHSISDQWRNSYDQYGFDKDGMYHGHSLRDPNGFDKDGFNLEGFGRDGINRHTGIKFDESGRDKDGERLANPNGFAYRSETALTPNDDLIYAVKGVKNGVALMVGMLNPVVGLLIAAYQPGESSNDLRNIDEALARGAYINFAEQHSGYTALIYGAYKGYPDIVAHLIEKGACANIKEKGGYNAYTMAQYYVNWYTKLRARNESEERNWETRSRMHRHYQDLVFRYQKIVDMLDPLTHDKQMPSSWWN